MIKRNYQKCWFLFQLLCLLCVLLVASRKGYTQNKATGFGSGNTLSRLKEAAVIPGDFADPSVIRRGNVYYATGTSSEWAPHFPLFSSTDLLHWKQVGYVFDKTPSWTSSSFWAPELFYRNGIYFVYYVARKKTDGISCIGVATSKDPDKGFTDRGILLEFGKEAIDPFVVEDDGQLYITWKAYGLDKRPIEILGSRLSGDGLKVEGEPFTLLRDEKREGLEGQCLVKRAGFWYLFYSPGACCGRGCSYKVEVARSAALRGPYTKFEANPILAQTEEWKCTGHGTVVSSKEGSDFFLYHAYSKADGVYTGRQGMLGKVDWDSQTGWPAVQPVGEKVTIKKIFRDEFSSARLFDYWQWDFRHAQSRTKIDGGVLYLSGDTTADNPTGTALTVRPFTGNYDMETEIANQNAAFKGLVVYGDAGQSVGIGVTGNRVQLWEVKKEGRSVVKEEAITGTGAVQLKMNVEGGYRMRFYWRSGDSDWHELAINNGHYNGEYLPPWDRSPRPGLLQKGHEPGAFRYFQIRYR